jgi:DnaJ-class molecular chaperone
MNAPATIPAPVQRFAHEAGNNKIEVCLVCRGEGRVPYVAVDRFTGDNTLTTATCCRCLGAGRIKSN